MKNKYLVEGKEFDFRRANIEDNLYEIAELIYKTDPYIYTFWFNNNIEEAKEYLVKLIKTPGTLFYVDNLYIAIQKDNNKIIGALCAIDKSVDLTYDYKEDMSINDNYRITIEKYVYSILDEINEINDSDYLYMSNLCINEELRGKKIGSYLMGYFISQMEEKGFNTFALDCLLHNLRAKNLYHSMGFKEMKEIVGFDGTDHSTVEVVSFLRKKGNYYPTEFQISFLDRR